MEAECNARGVEGEGNRHATIRIYEKKMQTENMKINTNSAAVAVANCSWIFTYRGGDNN